MQTIVYQCDTAMPAQKLQNCWTWKNYPILNEPGKGRYAMYFRLNERAVGFS